MTRKKYSQAERQEQITGAALRLLADHRLAGISTRMLAAELGLTQPALFRHFPSRDHLLAAVVDRAREGLVAELAPLLTLPESPTARLRRLAQEILGYVESNPGLPRLLFADDSQEAGELRVALERLLSTQRNLVRSLLRDGIDRGEIRLGIEEPATVLYVSLLQGLVLDWQRQGRPPGLAEKTTEVIALWLDGVRGDGTPPPEPSGRILDLLELDVRPILKQGVDPLARILQELDTLATGAALHILAPFRPEPLLALLRSKGHGVDVAESIAGLWSVVVVLGDTCPVEDLRLEEPPGPMEAVLIAVEKPGPYAARLPRLPKLLVSQLEQRDRVYRLVELPDHTALIWIAP